MSFWSNIFRILTLTCDDSTRLVSESLDRELTFSEKTAVRAHELGCRFCRRFRRQIVLLRRVVRLGQIGHSADQNPEGPELSPATADRIKRMMAEQG